GIGGGCTTLEGCSTPTECDTTGRKLPQQDRPHKRWREANGGAQCGKSACCVRRGGDWKRGTVERPAGAPALDPTCERPMAKSHRPTHPHFCTRSRKWGSFVVGARRSRNGCEPSYWRSRSSCAGQCMTPSRKPVLG